MVGQIVPVEVTVYQDSSFSFLLKTPPAADLLKQRTVLAVNEQNPEPSACRFGASQGVLITVPSFPWSMGSPA
jgi:ribosomal protein L11